VKLGCLNLGSVKKTSAQVSLGVLPNCSEDPKKRSEPLQLFPTLPLLSLHFNLSASFHFILPFFHTQLLQRRQRRNLLKIIRCPLLGFDNFVDGVVQLRGNCCSRGFRFSVFGFRFRPPQVSMDTSLFVLYYKTYCCSPTSTALCLFFNLREAVQLKTWFRPLVQIIIVATLLLRTMPESDLEINYPPAQVEVTGKKLPSCSPTTLLAAAAGKLDTTTDFNNLEDAPNTPIQNQNTKAPT